jgi:hypothetical protein
MTVILMSWLLHPELYTPHGFCLAWRPELIWLHVISDGVIALAYFAIPISLAIFVRRRTDLEPQHKALAILFSLFITACGFTHLASIVVLWLPLYGVEGLIKAVTALVSATLAHPFALGSGTGGGVSRSHLARVARRSGQAFRSDGGNAGGSAPDHAAVRGGSAGFPHHCVRAG